MGYLASGFKNVDESDDRTKYSSCLNFLQDLEFFRNYKDDSHKMLALYDGLRVLDLGCGLGHDLIEIAKLVGPTGTVVGVDSSESLLDMASSKIVQGSGNIELKQSDALNLEFEDETFDRCKIDRTLQHLSNPKLALSEMERVLKPGGIMLAFDNDWETFTFSSSNRDLVRRVANHWCDSFASGWIGRYLYKYFIELGLTEVEVHPRTLVVNELQISDKVFDLYHTIKRMTESKELSEKEAKDLIAEIEEQDKSNMYFSSYTGFIVVGRKPA